MLKDIITCVTQKLAEQGAQNVYSAFDAQAVEKKGSGIFTVVGVSWFECSSPIYTKYTLFMPYKAELDINVTAPERYTLEQLYSYYDEYIDPVISDMTGLTCSLKKLTLKYDSNLRRLVLNVKLGASGIFRSERS